MKLCLTRRHLCWGVAELFLTCQFCLAAALLRAGQPGAGPKRNCALKAQSAALGAWPVVLGVLAMPDNGVAVCRPARGRRAKKPCLTAQPAALGLAVACTGTVVDLGLVEAVLAAAVSGSACPPRRAPGLQQHPGLRAGLPHWHRLAPVRSRVLLGLTWEERSAELVANNVTTAPYICCGWRRSISLSAQPLRS